MSHVGRAGAQVGRQLRDLARVGLRLYRPVEGLLEPGRGDQLHGPRDLADVADRLAAFDDGSCFCHGSLLTAPGTASGTSQLPRPTVSRARDSACVLSSEYYARPGVARAC